MKYITGYYFYLLLAILSNFLFQALPIAIDILTSYVLSAALLGNTDFIKQLFIAICIFIPASGICSYLDILFSHDMAYKILTELRNKAYDKIDQVAPAALEGKQSGDLISIVMEDIEILEWFFAHIIPQSVVSIIISVAVLLFMARFSWALVLCILPFLLALAVVPRMREKTANEQGKTERTQLGILNAEIVDGIQGLKDILSFRWQKTYFRRFFKANDDYNNAFLAYSERSAKEKGLVSLLVEAGSLCGQIAVIVLLLRGKIDMVWFIPLMTLSVAVFRPVTRTINMEVNFGMIFGAENRLYNLFQMESAIQDTGKGTAEAVLGTNKNGKVCITFDDIEFTYPAENENIPNEPVLKGLSFSVASGETVALVGASGEGKTTVARLLQRFWDVDSGAILLNGTDIRELQLCELRNLCTVVPQESYFFNMSIEENLRYAKQDAGWEAISNATQSAQIDCFIEKLPLKYDTVIGERGMRLSGGERQRLSIAQALLKNAPVLVLDEASANLDSENEQLINLAINNLKSGKSTLIIAHRISTIKSADRIVVMKDGRVECEGQFEELILNSQYFRKLIGNEYEAQVLSYV